MALGGHADQIPHRQSGATTGCRGRRHRDRRIHGGVSGAVEFGQCRGDDHGDRVAAVHTESAGSDGGFQAKF